MFNGIQRPHHDKLGIDDQLVESGLRMLEEISEETQSELVGSFRDMCVNLYRDCRRIRTEAFVMARELDFL